MEDHMLSRAMREDVAGIMGMELVHSAPHLEHLTLA